MTDARWSEPLLLWFAENQRKLPWREHRTAYRVWVSEIMLQQTRVETVLKFYEPFVRAFPTVFDLARAPLADVLARWAGLGYYGRAHALWKGARHVVDRWGGEFPESMAELRQIPGVGQYTAAAIRNLAFGLATPLVDGNVARVLSRWFRVESALGSSTHRAEVDRLASLVLPRKNGHLFVEALMELGALVCTPRAPKCGECPVRHLCESQGEDARRFPVHTAKRERPLVCAVAFVSEHKGRVLLVRRGPDGLWPGLWEPPMFEGRSKQAAARRLVAYATHLQHRGTLRHLLTHRTFDVDVWTGRPKARAVWPRSYDASEWVDKTALSVAPPSHALSALARKVLRAAGVLSSVLAGAMAPTLARAEARRTYIDTWTHAAVGKGLRFNNPYRLDRQLGKTGESLSLSATYAEVGTSVLFGEPNGWQHGLGLRGTTALMGVAQSVVTPAYTSLFRRSAPWVPYLRLGFPWVQGPEPNIGLEASAGTFVLLRGTFGLVTEVGWSGYYGAATRQVRATAIPLVFAQAGIAYNWEKLP